MQLKLSSNGIKSFPVEILSIIINRPMKRQRSVPSAPSWLINNLKSIDTPLAGILCVQLAGKEIRRYCGITSTVCQQKSASILVSERCKICKSQNMLVPVQRDLTLNLHGRCRRRISFCKQAASMRLKCIRPDNEHKQPPTRHVDGETRFLTLIARFYVHVCELCSTCETKNFLLLGK